MEVRSFAVTLSAVLGLIGSTAAAQDTVTLRMSSTATEGTTFAKAQEMLRDDLAEITDGRVELQIFNNYQLGSGRESLELAKMGNVDLVVTGASHPSGFAPEFNAVVFPYVWRDRETMFDALDGEIGARLSNSLEDDNLSIAAWWDNGFRHVSNNVGPIMEPEDMEGLKLRTLPSSVHVQFFRALGAEPTPMDWNETIPALRQGVLDGQENPPVIVYPYRVYEVQDYYSLTKHVNEPMIVAMSGSMPGKLSEKDMAAFREAMDKATDYQRRINAEANEELLEKLRGVMEVNEVPEDTLAAFREAARDVNAEAAGDLGANGEELLQAIYEANQ